MSGICAVAKSHHAMWKRPHADPDQSYTSDIDAVTMTRGEVEYLGINFRWSSPDEPWGWSHVAKNVERWLAQASLIRNKQVDHRSWKELAFLTGVLIWDWVLEGSDRRSMEEVLKATHKIGKASLTNRSDWHKPADVDDSTWNALIGRLDRVVLMNGGRGRHISFGKAPGKTELLAASDACNDGVGGADLQDNMEITLDMPSHYRTLHITRKETAAALWTLQRIIKKWNGYRVRVIIALDNTVAVAALNKRIVMFEKVVDDLMKETEALYRERESEWVAIYVPGEIQPADEPSRGLQINLEKCEQTKQRLLDRKRVWCEEVQGWQRHKSDKRERVEGEVLCLPNGSVANTLDNFGNMNTRKN